MKFRIFIFFVWVSCCNIVSSYRQYQDFGHDYEQHRDRSINRNYARNTPVYSTLSLNHAGPSHVSHYALHPEPQYVPRHQQEAVVENIAESPAQSQVKSNDVEHNPLMYIPQPHQELSRPYPVENTFELHLPTAEYAYSPDYTQHAEKPWVSQKIYQPTIHQKPYHEPIKSYHQPPVQQKSYHQKIMYSEQQPSVYQYPTTSLHVQPQHPTPLLQSQPQHPQPQHPTPPQPTQPQRPPPPQQPTPHQQPPHQQTYYKSQPSYAVPVAQAQAYATSETNVADILASKPEVKDYLESALLKHYQLDDLGNSQHVKSSDIKLEENDNNIEGTTEIPHNYHQNNKHLQKQLLDNDDNQNKKLYVPKNNNHIVNPQTIFEETKHETIPPKNDDNETIYHPRFAYLNHKKNPTEVKRFPIEVKPVNPHHYRYPIVNHHTHANYPDNNLVDKKSATPLTSLGNTDDSYPIEPQLSIVYETSTLKDKEDTLYDHDVPAHEHHSKKQPEQYTDKIHSENDYIPTIKHSKIPSHSKHTDQTNIENPVDKPVDTPSYGINKPKDFIEDVTPLLLYSDTIGDTKAPLTASHNFKYDKPNKEFYSDQKKQPEVAKPTTENVGDVVTDPIVSQKEDTEKIFVIETDVTKANKIDDKKQTINENVSDNSDKQQKAETEPTSTPPKDIAKQSPIEGSPLNADSPTDGTSTEQNDDCTSGEIDPNINAGDEEAADSANNINAILLSSIDLWDKLFLKQQNTEFQAFNVVTLSPIVEKTSRLFAFPNQTTVEESVETVWACKGDALPLEIKLTTIIKNPRQKHACKSDKTEQDQTKCD